MFFFVTVYRKCQQIVSVKNVSLNIRLGGNGGRGKEKERRKEEDLLKYKSVSIQHETGDWRLETGDKVNQESSTVQWHSSYILY